MLTMLIARELNPVFSSARCNGLAIYICVCRQIWILAVQDSSTVIVSIQRPYGMVDALHTSVGS